MVNLIYNIEAFLIVIIIPILVIITIGAYIFGKDSIAKRVLLLTAVVIVIVIGIYLLIIRNI